MRVLPQVGAHVQSERVDKCLVELRRARGSLHVLLEVMQVLPQGTLRYQGNVPLPQLPQWAREAQRNHSRIQREAAAERRSRRTTPVAMDWWSM